MSTHFTPELEVIARLRAVPGVMRAATVSSFRHKSEPKRLRIWASTGGFRSFHFEIPYSTPNRLWDARVRSALTNKLGAEAAAAY